MKWLDMISFVSYKSCGGKGNPDIIDIVYDSRSVKTGSVFIAIPGFKVHGDTFISSAIKKGAVAVITENRQNGNSIPWIQVDDPRKVMSLLSIKLWNVNFDNIMAVGITGTDGKTTTVNLYHALQKEIYGIEESWMFSTVVYSFGKHKRNAVRTTPEAVDILRSIGTAEKKPKAITMEVSSHALVLHRVENYLFDICVWTNLTQDHLDFHGSMESYYQAKKILFVKNLKMNGIAAINIDDKWGMRLSNELKNKNKITYGYSENADVQVTSADCSFTGTNISVKYMEKSIDFRSKLVGAFNVYNMTALIAGALGKGISEKIIRKSFDSIEKVPGRMEKINIDTEFSVIVDYAHTPGALENLLIALRDLTDGKLICMFGCGGDRDKGKRSMMGEISARYSDVTIITSDNPRSEKPEKIIEDILKGIPVGSSHLVITDRKIAVKEALKTAKKGDCVIIAGKGHETYQEINGIRHHFDDREIVLELFKEIRLEKNYV